MTNKPKYYDFPIDEIKANIDRINAELDKIWDCNYSWEEYVEKCKPHENELLEYTAALFLKKDIKDIEFCAHSELDKRCLIPKNKFTEFCVSHMIIGYDGTGYYSTENEISDIPAYPIHFEKGYIRDDFDYVVWYNR